MTNEMQTDNFTSSCIKAIAINVAVVTLIHLGGCVGQNRAYQQITENISVQRAYTNSTKYLLIKTKVNTLAHFKDQNKELKLYEYDGTYIPLEKIRQLESDKIQRQVESNLTARLQEGERK